MSYQRAYGTIDEMMNEFSWFQKCLKAATFTEIGESYDVKEFLESGMQLSPSSRPDTRKELHFDLGTAALSENYSSIRPNATMLSPISRVPVVSSFRFPPIRLSVRSRISSVPKSVI